MLDSPTERDARRSHGAEAARIAVKDALLNSLNHPFFRTVLIAFTWLLLMRGVLILHSGVLPNPLWMLASDVVGALLLAVLLTVTKHRVWRAILVILLGLAYFAAGQHLASHGTIFRIAHILLALDPVFLGSSVVNPALWLLPGYLLLAWLLHRAHRRWVATPAWPGRVVWVVMALAVALHVAVTSSLTMPANSVVVSALAQGPVAIVRAGLANHDDDEVDGESPALPEAYFHRAVAGGEPARGVNVLVIMVEGLSSGYLPGVSDLHNLTPVVSLASLEADLDRRGFRIYRNVLSMQRQTNRGSYALLCGDYPRVGTDTPKMTEIAEGAEPPLCLPHVLADLGYRTTYLQAAPLQYMGKSEFMPRVGFQNVHGAASFAGDENTPEEGWGPPDSVFFPAVAKRLVEDSAKDQPWFTVMLNVGTHHPFPSETESEDTGADLSFLPEARQDDRRAAMHRMERALKAFLTTLEDEGLLSNTLVVITSDESGGFLYKGEEGFLLDGNMGMLAVRPPDHIPLDRIAGAHELVAQLDVPLTVLDLLGAPEAAPGMIGRSLLVADDAPRALMLGDTYAGRTYFVRESGSLLACGEALVNCDNWRFIPGRLFGSLQPSDKDIFLTLAQRRALTERAAQIRRREVNGR